MNLTSNAARIARLLFLSAVLLVSVSVASASASPSGGSSALDRAIGHTAGAIRVHAGSAFACYRPNSYRVGRVAKAVVFVTSSSALRRARRIVRRAHLSRSVKVKLTASTDTDAARNALWKSVQAGVNQLPADQRDAVLVNSQLFALGGGHVSGAPSVTSCETNSLRVSLGRASAATLGWAHSLQAQYGADRLPVEYAR